MCFTLRCTRDLDGVKVKGDDQKAGVEIVKKALQAPIRQITANAGVDGSVVVGKLLEGKKVSQGYDAQNEDYVDMFAKGIIDPTKVVRSALQDAALEIASTINYNEAMIADKPEEKEQFSPNSKLRIRKRRKFAAFFFEIPINKQSTCRY